jgi:MFS family permease
VALLAMAAGFGQFGAVAALGSVAKAFGHFTGGASFADQAGLSGTELGIGLAIFRLASLGGLPLTSLADRFGRRTVLVGTCALGLLFTMAAAASPTFWWFVAIFALGRPLLSATNGLASVAAVELTSSAERAKAVALMAAGYALGAGLTAVINAELKGSIGFRGVFALAVVPLAFVPLIRRMLVEPDRFALLAVAEHQPPVIGPVEPRFRRRLLLVATLSFAISVITGPANSLAYIYAQNVLHLGGSAITAMVVCSGVAGLGGLLAGRKMADGVGRRPTVAIAMVALAASGTLTYSGSKWALVVGFVAGVTSGGFIAPAGGALINELFPTQVRASVMGWNIAAGVLGAVVGLVVFGALADVGGVADHAGFAALLTFWPAVPVAGLLWFLPETRGRELEDLDAPAAAA